MKQKGFILLPVLIIVVLLGIIGYVVFQNNQLKNSLQKYIVTGPTPTTNEEVTLPQPTISPNQNGNTYTSKALGIEFNYATYLDVEKSLKTKISEKGNKIYVYNSSLQDPTQGQFVEVFNKEEKDSIDTAINKRFLSGISEEDCFVVTKADPDNPSFIQATISYPWPDKNEPKFLFGEKCPENYKETNGISYFLMDTKHPASFIFLSIGQVPGPASSDLPNSPEWFKSIRVLK